MSTISSGNRTLVLSALRYFGLVSPRGVSTAQLVKLVTAEGQARRDLWRRILKRAYPKLFELDFQRTTTEEFSEVFRSLGVSSPATIRKCITVFLFALKDAGLEISAHVKPYAGSRPFWPRSGKFPAFDPKWSLQERENWLIGFKQLMNVESEVARDQPQIFISYSNQDQKEADLVCASLEARGFRCWIANRDISVGSEWGESIVQAINNSQVMVLLFSSRANESEQIKREVERAVTKKVPILTLLIERVSPSGSFEYYLSTVQWLDAWRNPLKTYMEQLTAGVIRLSARH